MGSIQSVGKYDIKVGEGGVKLNGLSTTPQLAKPMLGQAGGMGQSIAKAEGRAGGLGERTARKG